MGRIIIIGTMLLAMLFVMSCGDTDKNEEKEADSTSSDSTDDAGTRETDAENDTSSVGGGDLDGDTDRDTVVDTDRDTERTVTLRGTLTLRLTNEFPAFDETAVMEVTVYNTNEMEIEEGSLAYDADDEMEQARMARSGNLAIAPTGIFNPVSDHYEIIENTTVTEHLQTWVWDGTSWMSVLDQNVDEFWDGGLAFKKREAETDGAVIEATSALGSVTWTLVLMNAIR